MDIKKSQMNNNPIFEENKPIWKKRRYLIVLLAFFGFFNVYALRVNLSVAIVAMTENRTVELEDGTKVYEQDFDWDSKQKGVVLSSFFYGYITTQFLGGYLGFRFGGNRIFGLGILMTAIFTLLTPFAAKTNFYFLIIVRVIEGIFEGVTFPCIADVWSKWAPPLERSKMSGFAMAGNYVGTVIAFPLSGVFSKVFGWESVFYIFGCVGIIWFIAWSIVVKRTPQEDHRISEEEKNYITRSLGNEKARKELKFSEVPWKKIWTSLPVWAFMFAHFCESWGFFTMLTELPSFMKDTLDFDLTKAGFVSALPYLAMSITLFFSSFLADWLQVKKILTTTQVRRYFNCTSFALSAVFLILCAFILHKVYTVMLLTFGVAVLAFSLSGFAVNHLDIAPNYASILFGISNFFASVPGIVSPILTGFIVTTSSRDEWQIVFYIAAGIYLCGSIFYWFFASGEVQTWAIAEKSEENQ